MAIIPTVYGGGGGVLANGQTLGVAFPPMLDRISWLFPLRHATRAMSTATATDVVGSGCRGTTSARCWPGLSRG